MLGFARGRLLGLRSDSGSTFKVYSLKLSYKQYKLGNTGIILFWGGTWGLRTMVFARSASISGSCSADSLSAFSSSQSPSSQSWSVSATPRPEPKEEPQDMQGPTCDERALSAGSYVERTLRNMYRYPEHTSSHAKELDPVRHSGMGIPATSIKVLNSGSRGLCPREAALLKAYVKDRMSQDSNLMAWPGPFHRDPTPNNGP